MGKGSTDECQPFACAIQACLQQNNYQQDACQSAIEAMLNCCEQNASKDYPSCDGFKFMLKKRAEKREQQKSAKN